MKHHWPERAFPLCWAKLVAVKQGVASYSKEAKYPTATALIICAHISTDASGFFKTKHFNEQIQIKLELKNTGLGMVAKQRYRKGLPFHSYLSIALV